MLHKRTQDKLKKLLIGIILIFGVFIYTTYLEEPINKYLNKFNEMIEPTISSRKVDGNLVIYFVDVGQADCILISNNDHYMLIDAGNNEDGPKLVNYFKGMGISKFDYVIGTHAHEDHIGGLDDIINNFDIKTFYMPDVSQTTYTFESVLDALERKNIYFETPKEDNSYKFGNSSFTVLSVGTDSTDLNNTSIVLKLTYGNNSFLFTGDATSSVERKILDKDISADVLKVGHHGSQYSSSANFLKTVYPKYAVIQVGKNNEYGHPKSITLNKLKKINAKIYRTDKDGTIICTSDGNNISFISMETDTNG
ncbi:MAG: MBL fold metallo-hydrolase [Bacilli bacterium]|nr:MBL fold metallo-hydrolase [Bacilli bacterium]